MKKSLKLFILFVFALFSAIVGNNVVYAADKAPSTFKASTHNLVNNPLGLTNTINVKKTTDGKYIYCFDVNKYLPTTSINYTKSELITDPAISYIIASGYNDKTDHEFFATQAALWIRLIDTNKMSDTKDGYINKIKTAAYSSKYYNDAVAKSIRSKLEGAKNAANSSNNVVFEIATDNVNFTLTDDTYVSDVIKVNSTLGNDYSVYLSKIPMGTKIIKVDNGFMLTIPKESVSVGKTTIRAVIQDVKTVYNVYKYTASNSNYQNMLTAYSDNVSVNDEISISIIKEEEPTTVIISKQDITNRGVELPGAILVVRNSRGSVVQSWISTNVPMVIDDLDVGTYTLTEVRAPEGYKLSTQTITFKVQKDGDTKKVIMYNIPEEENVVSISKQDITTKEEVPGATLIIRDSNGTEKYRWVSGEEPYIIKGIEDGKYTLEEIIAPEGYKLSNEKITFEVKNNGVVTELVMFNVPVSTEVIVVPPTGMNTNTIAYIIGGLVIIIGSVLIYKNVKKEQ